MLNIAQFITKTFESIIATETTETTKIVKTLRVITTVVNERGKTITKFRVSYNNENAPSLLQKSFDSGTFEDAIATYNNIL